MTEDTKPPDFVERIIHPREIQLGGFTVRRALPAMGIDGVGPWVFFDHMGPASFPPGEGVDVPPHPHINLATVTHLFEGELVHRDSLGSVQTIAPGAVNLMVAGSGIAHSERTGPELRSQGHRMNGLQLWAGLPEHAEEADPLFLHYPAEALPRAGRRGAEVRVMIGEAFGLRSPVRTYSPTLYAEAAVAPGGGLELPEGPQELAIYVVSGAAAVEDFELPPRTLVVFRRSSGGGAELRLSARENTQVAMIGGSPLGKRFMWWNFVSSRKERIEKAKHDWKEGRFAAIPGETELTPLPERDAFSERKELSEGRNFSE